MQRFRDTRCWIFDLDNTLYPADCQLFAQIDKRMGEFISGYLGCSLQDARRLQKDFYRKYGTTLSGLMTVHGLEPNAFLDYVHDIDLAPVIEAPALGEALDELPGRKFIFTNGSRRHAENVASKLGILDRFEDVFHIESCGYVPKPDRSAYEKFLTAFGTQGREAAMFEDLPHNLEMPHALGMATVLVRSSFFDHPSQRAIADWSQPPEHIHYVTDNLTGFLTDLVVSLAGDNASRETNSASRRL